MVRKKQISNDIREERRRESCSNRNQVGLKTTEQKVAYLCDKVPAATGNYKLLLLLYWQAFDGIDIPADIMNAIIEKGTQPESIGRLKRKKIRRYGNGEESNQSDN